MSSSKREGFKKLFTRRSRDHSAAPPTAVNDNGPKVEEEGQNHALVLAAPVQALILDPREAAQEALVTSLWERAYQAVAASDPDILRPFEQLLSTENGALINDVKLKSVLEKILREQANKDLTIGLAGESNAVAGALELCNDNMYLVSHDIFLKGSISTSSS